MFNIDMEGVDFEKTYDLIVLGGGPTAIGCAIYAARFALNVLIVGKTFGGLIATTHLVENYPGIASTSGQGLMDMFKEHMNSLSIPYISDEIRSIEKADDHFILHSFFQKFKAYTVCIATGSERKKLGIPGEDEFAGRGVSYCATCDGPFYKDKVVIVIGGSDSAAKEALFLSQNVKKVYIIYRGEEIRAEPINKKRVYENEKIEIIYKTNIVEIKGDTSVKSVIFDNGKEFDIDGVFIEVGSIPNSDLAKRISVKTDEKNEIIINRKSETNIPGIFAAGDVADAPFKQAITGVAEGVIAAYSAFDYVKKMNIEY
ncbi:MAG: thioredoxin-disulfide reductase [Promethearchaeota archaeon Loki_b31]|nr:MAG: thioredoxin-disulfide reductase [Candidatus Lokiarchaeota archaeon Loki_b31]